MLTYIDCCDDIVYPRAQCQIHLQTQPKGNKVFTSPIMAKPNVSAADLRSKSRLHPQFGNILGLKLMKMTTPSRRASFCLKKVSAAGGNTSNLERHLRDHHPTKA